MTNRSKRTYFVYGDGNIFGSSDFTCSYISADSYKFYEWKHTKIEFTFVFAFDK